MCNTIQKVWATVLACVYAVCEQLTVWILRPSPARKTNKNAAVGTALVEHWISKASLFARAECLRVIQCAASSMQRECVGMAAPCAHTLPLPLRAAALGHQLRGAGGRSQRRDSSPPDLSRDGVLHGRRGWGDAEGTRRQRP
eukprot:COSAG01_NODE_26618_length_708_cov_0.847291_1_plen_141_part_10